jgi:hypothetical protein
MKTRNLLIALSVVAMTTVNVLATETLLSPKAVGQSKAVSGYNTDPNLAATGLQSASPRVLDSKTKTVAGKSTEVTPSLVCARRMSGSPKMIGACAEHATDATMSCCAPAAAK